MVQDKQDGLKPDETEGMAQWQPLNASNCGGNWKGRKAGKSPENIVA